MQVVMLSYSATSSHIGAPIQITNFYPQFGQFGSSTGQGQTVAGGMANCADSDQTTP